MRTRWLGMAVAAGLVIGACGNRKPVAGGGDEVDAGAGGDAGMTGAAGGSGGAAGNGGSAGSVGGAAGADVNGCSDLFDAATLASYAVDITDDEWAKMTYEFLNRATIEAAGQNYKPYHPIVFHYGTETVTDAMMRLKGQSSWRHTVRDDPNPKMQFVIAFDQVNPKGKFHGVDKIVLDMPNNDFTFLHERLSFAALRDLGRPAPCSNSGQITINGQFYGVYSNEENEGHPFLKRVYPLASDGDFFKGGWTPETNVLMPNWTRLQAFWDAHDASAMAAVVDMDDALSEWASEMLLNDGDGYWGGSHNFYLYDYPGGAGYRWLVSDADATFEWLGTSDENPIYWWAGRTTMQKPGQHYLIVMNDPTWRARYIQKIQELLPRWDAAKMQARVDAWASQIAAGVAADPHKAVAVTVAAHTQAVAAMRAEVADRPVFVAKFLACQAGTGSLTDGDGDGVTWCNDCNDGNAAVHPGAQEICGNGIDDNCDGVKDEGCAVDGGVGPEGGAASDGGAPVPAI